MEGALGSVGSTLGLATLPGQDLAVTRTRDSVCLSLTCYIRFAVQRMATITDRSSPTCSERRGERYPLRPGTSIT
jgi:hypothetical protein